MSGVTTEVVLAARGITKAFPGVRALDTVDLTLRRGTVTALVGENGAGKSTLMNILSGVFPPDAGSLELGGAPLVLPNPHAAQAHGIVTIFQELSLLPNLTVAENLLLGREPRTRLGLVDYAAMHAAARELLGRVALPIAPDCPVAALRVGQQQMVEIARGLARQPRVLILDEPTSALSDRETDVLFERIAELKRDGIAIVYISHRLEELPRIADDVVVMRDGRVVATSPLAELSRAEMVRLMVGRETMTVGAMRERGPVTGNVLRVENLSLRDARQPERFLVCDVSFTVSAGEVVGVFGLMGAGRTEMLEAICGLHHGRTSGGVFIGGEATAIRSPADAIARGMVLAPEDRKREGLVLEMSVQHNASLACLRRAERSGWLDVGRERELILPLLERFRVRVNSLREPVRTLSGGNQQKVILAKWMATEPRILLLDEPTRGIDVGAKAEIYALVAELAARGLAVVVVSSELPEALAISDRLLVMNEGRIAGEFARGEATPEKVLHAALPRAA